MPETFRIGVIGCTGRGGFGHRLDTAWKAVPETRIVAIADCNESGLARHARKLGIERTFLDYRRMLDEVKPDIAAIAPRWADQHRDMVVAAARRGVHVYMEKPFCRTLQEADEIVATCEKTDVKLAIAHPTHYSPKLETVRQLISDGRIGTVLEYRARGKEDRRGGGEDLWVLGTHVLDMIRTIGGHPLSCFSQVTQDGRPVTRSDVVEGNEGLGPLAGDHVEAVYRMPGGATASFSSRRHAGSRPSRYGLRILGSSGVIELVEGTMPPVKFLDDPTWSPGRSRAKWQDVSTAGIGQPEPLSGPEYSARHTLAIRDLIEAIREDRSPLNDVYDARGVVEMILAVFESQRVGGPVRLPLRNRRHPLTMLGQRTTG